MWAYFWVLYSIPLNYMSVFVLVPCCFDYCSFVVQPEVWEHDTSQLCSFFSRLLWQFEVICGSTQIVGLFVLALQKMSWVFYRDCTKSVDCFGQYRYFNNINSSNPRSQDIFPFLCIIFKFLHQCFMVFRVQVFHLLG